MGLRSAHRRITRKEIQSVSIPQTCDEIKKPDNALTLRIKSSLLYGVALVYKQKTDYLNSDVSNVRTRIQRGLNPLKGHASKILMPMASEADVLQRLAKQVVLRDDPSFNIDGGLLPPLAGLDFLQTSNAHDDLQKRGIQQVDQENNVVSLPVDQLNLRESGAHFMEEDGLQGMNPEFAFNDDGFIVDIVQDDIRPDTDYQLGDGSFNLAFDVDPQPAEDHIREMDQILEEVEEPRVGQNQDHAQATPPRVCPKKRMRTDTSQIVVDMAISICTEDLRNFRDNYVSVMKSKAKKPKYNNYLDFTLKDPLLPDFLPVVAVDAIERGRQLHREDGDFVDSLNRHRRSSVSSIESGRHVSVSSRRHSRASLAAIDLPWENAPLADADHDFDYRNELDEFPLSLEDHSTTSGSSKKRSSSLLRLPELQEERHDASRDKESVSATGNTLRSGHGHGTMLKFLAFLQSRFEEENCEELSFEKLIDYETDRSIVVKSFYEVLQLATLNGIKVSVGQSIGDFGLMSAAELSIRLA